MKTALITGITGQDGSYLSEFLLSKNYQVHGIVRRASTFNTQRLDPIYEDPHEAFARLHLHYGDVTDGTGLRRILEKACPDEVYNLAAQSHVRVSFRSTRIHRRCSSYRYSPDAGGRKGTTFNSRVNRSGSIQAGSSEMFGAAPPPQNEATPFYPRSPLRRE